MPLCISTAFTNGQMTTSDFTHQFVPDPPNERQVNNHWSTNLCSRTDFCQRGRTSACSTASLHCSPVGTHINNTLFNHHHRPVSNHWKWRWILSCEVLVIRSPEAQVYLSMCFDCLWTRVKSFRNTVNLFNWCVKCWLYSHSLIHAYLKSMKQKIVIWTFSIIGSIFPH